LGETFAVKDFVGRGWGEGSGCLMPLSRHHFFTFNIFLSVFFNSKKSFFRYEKPFFGCRYAFFEVMMAYFFMDAKLQ